MRRQGSAISRVCADLGRLPVHAPTESALTQQRAMLGSSSGPFGFQRSAVFIPCVMGRIERLLPPIPGLRSESCHMRFPGWHLIPGLSPIPGFPSDSCRMTPVYAGKPGIGACLGRESWNRWSYELSSTFQKSISYECVST